MAGEGVGYFPLYCVLDEKFELLEAEYGLKGFAIVVKLFQRIYGGYGYYCEWSDDIALIFAKQCGFSNIGEATKNNSDSLGCAECSSQPGKSKNLIDQVVAASIRRGIFDKKLFEECSILTSRGIQRNFLTIVRNRKKVEVKKEYLLLSDAEIKGNIVIVGSSYVRNNENDVRNEQSEEKENKEENNNMCKTDVERFWHCLWKMYPVKKGKGQVSYTQKTKLYKIGFNEMSRAIERYIKYVDSIDYLSYQNGSTFFNSGYIDYLDENYVPDKKPVKQAGQFNSFPQHDYDFERLEREIVSN